VNSKNAVQAVQTMQICAICTIRSIRDSETQNFVTYFPFDVYILSAMAEKVFFFGLFIYIAFS
jgi:hypothetical protein